jgi:hypothetical protein
VSLLAIYLNDHLAGSTLARDLVRRSAASNRGSRYQPFLDDLAVQIDEDRESLLAIMGRLGTAVNRFKMAGAWSAEKLSRLKLNGQIVGYSPLSRLIELEVLTLGVRGKLALWLALVRLEERDHPALRDAPLSELIERAERQLEALETHRLLAVDDALAADYTQR